MSPVKLSLFNSGDDREQESVELDDELVDQLRRVVDAHPDLTMQEALRQGDLAGVLSYPVTGNRNGKTQVVVQFEGDGIVDSHYIYRQLETVKHQYSCFLGSYIRDGVPTVPPPNVLAHPCQ
jgi:hypothetical protein